MEQKSTVFVSDLFYFFKYQWFTSLDAQNFELDKKNQ